ncbi:HNH endonuclease [Nakamurella multipartita]|uniref:HNH nuclease n=1 Tax=Nakamurella multipartita (strain ATCC 700099 / DSM 44233 / CIP 104796 / JCM 9543 / NBRC 105858 / Y-104) TaxID=479431 RepID=C8XDY5_NAKMY|nr:DUF222 domain-containing protein [Nakamurella multipartita]ACV79688.1 HNH nuclease [Nakamurella multipartita DSM 44233]
MSNQEQIAAMVSALAAMESVSDDERIVLVGELEGLKSVAAAAQARFTDAFAVSQRARLLEAGSTSGEAARSITGQVGLARRDSSHKGSRHVGLAAALVREMPRVLAVLGRGQTSEWRCTVIARETAHLSPADRARIDEAIAPVLPGWGDARTEREVRAWVHRLDAQGAAARAAKAAVDRRVSIRPAPDCMAYVTALLPMAQGVAVFGALHRAALAGAVDPGERRSKGQIMADELVRRVLTPGAGQPEVPGIELHVVMTDRALLDGDNEPAQVVGYGPVPAPVARELVRADSKTRVWVRRLYTNPETGELAGTDARKRDFPDVVRQFFLVRDQVCRTPWCGAPIRHVDHAVAVAKGGVTDLRNGNGRCARCNLTKDLPGWVSVLRDGAIVTSTPTGQQYASRPPRPPRSDSWESADDLPATTGG